MLIMSITTEWSQSMRMKNPLHPGTVILQECIETLGLTITQAAAAVGVTRNTLSELVNGKRGISPEMAVRLSKVFGGSEESWLVQQAQYDLAHVHRDQLKLKRLNVASKGQSPLDSQLDRESVPAAIPRYNYLWSSLFEFARIRASFHAHTVASCARERRRDDAHRRAGGDGRRNDALAAQLLRGGAKAER
jgi:addiction module HigA family antidote